MIIMNKLLNFSTWTATILFLNVFNFALGINADQNVFPEAASTEHILFSNGATDYSIALDADASDSEKWAAQELQYWLMKISNAYFPIIEYNDKRFDTWGAVN